MSPCSPVTMTTSEGKLPPGSTLGIVGGGQLGRMLALAASRLGIRTHIFCPDPDSPAFAVTPRHTVAAYDDAAALEVFAATVDVITYEFENVPARTAALLAAARPLRPGANALAVAQDRLAEKAFLLAHGIPVAAHRAVHTASDAAAALAALGAPAVLKTTRLGYDGKGQRLVRTAAEAEAACAALAPSPFVLEAFVPFVRELSVVAARGMDGQFRAFDVAENVHRDGILRTSRVPAGISAAMGAEAVRITEAIATALDYVGVLGVEFFQDADNSLVVNEMAPRVHNSGHWTEAVCATDQFEQHVRAILGWPLGVPTRWADVVMENLIGDEVFAAPGRAEPGARLHLYGKSEARPGRKMGHINHLRATALK